LAKANPNTYLHAEGMTLPAFVTTNFGIGLYGNYQGDAEYFPGTSNFQLHYFNDWGAVVGYCFRLFSGRLKIGLSGKIIDRTYINGNFASTATNLSLSTIGQEGIGAGWDGSIMLSAPWALLPSLTAVVHDVGGTNFTLAKGIFTTNNNPPPPPQQQSVDVGVAVFPIFDNHTRGSFAVEYRDVLNYNSAMPLYDLHAGAEINFNDVFFIRGGMNETYWTAGLEFAFGHSQIQLASYGEDIGTPPYYTEDRRYVIEYAFRF
jgi:hypothetical protein